MKTINVSFEDSEMEALQKAKGKQSWHDFILEGMEIRDISIPIIRGEE